MKPYKFYKVNSFPELTLTNPIISSKTQRVFSFYERGAITTDIKLIKQNHYEDLDFMSLTSGVWRSLQGYIHYHIRGSAHKIDLNGYVKPVTFDLYYAKQRQVVLFQAARKVCKGVMDNLKEGDLNVDIIEQFVDIDKVCGICPKFRAITFRNLSNYMNSVSVYGNQLQLDEQFKQLAVLGEKSNVIINWNFEEEIHPIMVTEGGTLALVYDYKKTPTTELRLVLDVYDKFVKNAFGGTRPDRDDPFDPSEYYPTRTPRSPKPKKRK